MTRSLAAAPEAIEPTGEIDLRALGIALRRRSRLLVMAPLLACLLIAITVNLISPRYTAQTQVLLENQETFFTRPDRVSTQQADQQFQLDPEAVASQVQLMTSRDIARRAIKELGLEGNDEFDPNANGMNPVKRVLVLLGIMRDPTQETRDARIITAFLDKLTVYSPPKTRVIAIEFSSRDPELAARAANTVATLYLKAQSSAKNLTAQEAAESLSAQIADLRIRLVKADDAREQYRLQTGLLAGTNNMTISGQQLADINTDLSKARTAQADAQAKAQMIRQLLRSGQAVDVPDVINNDTVRRIAEQRVQYEGQLALEGRTLLPGHPRIKALQAQVAEYDRALKGAAKQAATTLENEATIAGARVKNLETVLGQQKTLAGSANVDEVHLRTLERAAQSIKDQLDSSTTKYQEALARASSDATPADARIIQRATPPQEASFPKKLPFIMFGTLAAFVLTVGYIAAGELMGGEGPDTVAVVDAEAEAVPARPIAPVPASTIVRERTIFRRRGFFGGPATTKPAKTKPAKTKPAKTSVDARAETLAEPWAETPDTRPAEDDDLVFTPVTVRAPRAKRPPASALRSVMAGGLVGSILGRMKAFGQSAAASRAERPNDDALELPLRDTIGWDANPIGSAAARTATAEYAVEPADDLAKLVAHIVGAHVPGHGLHIVGASVATDSAATIIELSRDLAAKGRTIVVDLNRSPTKLSSLTRAGDDADASIGTLHGLSELLVGEASFAEVIHRDHASRLHFIPTGRQEADFRDFDLILDALTATYDFIVLLAPAYPQSEIAKIMAPYADFVVLMPASGADAATLAQLETELAEAGAREVLVAGRARHPTHQDVA